MNDWRFIDDFGRLKPDEYVNKCFKYRLTIPVAVSYADQTSQSNYSPLPATGY